MEDNEILSNDESIDQSFEYFAQNLKSAVAEEPSLTEVANNFLSNFEPFKGDEVDKDRVEAALLAAYHIMSRGQERPERSKDLEKINRYL